MITIVTAIFNQLPMNQLFYEKLALYTAQPFELIVIDNGSTDGSKEFFSNLADNVKVIANDGNYSYPYCQNLGIKEARYDLLAFLNNDIIVSPMWDQKLREIMRKNALDIVTPCGIEKMENLRITRQYKRKWKIIKDTIGLFGYSKQKLELMHKLMYGNWEAFSVSRYHEFAERVIEGFVGNSVIMSRNVIDKIGLWDERMQCADFDLYLRSKERSIKHNDIKPVHVAQGVFHHHYIRLTMKSAYPPFKDAHNLISLEEKWGKRDVDEYLSAIN
jgi:GT2 family glycosyltransferase